MSVIRTAGVGVAPDGKVEVYEPPMVVPVASGASVGPTPPAAPRPGDSWFDGSALQIWDGAAWNVIGGGGSLTLPLAVVDGGTGATSATAALTALGALPLAGGVLSAGGIALNGVLRIDYTGTRGYGLYATLPATITTVPSAAIRAETNVALANTAAIIASALIANAVALECSGIGRGLVLLRSTTAPTLGVKFATVQFGVTTNNGVYAEISSAATQNHAVNNNGTRLEFSVTPNGTATAQTALIIDQDRRLSLWDGAALQPVTMGAADSGGTGYRALVMPN